MSTVVRRSESMGSGCLYQSVGLVCLLLALVTLTTVVGPIAFGLLGIALIAKGQHVSRWWACSRCGSKLSSKSVTICPACGSTLSR